MRPLLRVAGLWRRHWPRLGLGIAVSLAAMACAVALLAASGSLVARVALGGALAAGLALKLLGPARVALRYTERLVTHDAMFRALADLRVWFFRNLAANSAGGLGFSRAGDVLTRLVGDVEALDGLYLRIIVPLFGAVLLLPALLVLGLRVSWPAALLISLLFALAAFVLPAVAASGAVALGGRLTLARAGLAMAALDTLTGLREVRAFGAEGRMLAAVQARESTLLTAGRALARRGALCGAIALLCAQAGLLVILAFPGAHPAATVILALAAVAAFEAVAGLPRAGVLAGLSSAAATCVLEAAERGAAAPDPATPVAAPQTSGLRFEAVGFRWQPDRPAVLEGFTLDIAAGSRVALLGPSGAGKSTVAALALRVVSPQSGRVLLGGIDVAALAAVDLRARISWLSQDTHLFDDTLRANLALARPDADDAALWQALESARLAEFVRGLPDQLDTWIGEGGARLSGGQRRRLALARTLLSPAPLLLLDEPCAGLDAETEREFFATLNDTAEGRTIVLIVHRLTGVERLDRVWRLVNGRAVPAAA